METNCNKALRVNVFPTIINEKENQLKELNKKSKYQRILSIIDTLYHCGFNENIQLFNKLKDIYEEQFKWYKEGLDWIDNPWEIYNFEKVDDRKKFKNEIFNYIIENYNCINDGTNIEYDEFNNLFIEK